MEIPQEFQSAATYRVPQAFCFSQNSIFLL